METNRDTIEELTLVIEHTAYDHYKAHGDAPHEIASENVLRAILDGVVDLRPEIEREVLNTSVMAGRLSIKETMDSTVSYDHLLKAEQDLGSLVIREEVLVDA